MLTEAMKRKAVAIADEIMRSDIECTGIPGDRPMTYQLADERGHQVARIAEACDAIKDALEWLQLRGHARLEPGADFDTIVLTPPPRC
jgi:hypothetical protein